MTTIKLEEIRFPTRAAAVKACLDTGLERVRTCPVSGDPIPARRGVFGKGGFFVTIYKNGPSYKLSNATPHFQWAKGSLAWSVEQDVREGLVRVLGAARPPRRRGRQPREAISWSTRGPSASCAFPQWATLGPLPSPNHTGKIGSSLCRYARETHGGKDGSRGGIPEAPSGLSSGLPPRLRSWPCDVRTLKLHILNRMWCCHAHGMWSTSQEK